MIKLTYVRESKKKIKNKKQENCANQMKRKIMKPNEEVGTTFEFRSQR